MIPSADSSRNLIRSVVLLVLVVGCGTSYVAGRGSGGDSEYLYLWTRAAGP
jgi:hypothetical protein